MQARLDGARFQCTDCRADLHPSEDAVQAFVDGRGKEQELECAEGHVHSMHESALEARCHPSYYELYSSVGGIERGRVSMRVGSWATVRVVRPFQRLRHVSAVCRTGPESGGGGVLLRAFSHLDPRIADSFQLGVCQGSDGRALERVTVDWTAYGDVVAHRGELWRENLTQAATDVLAHSYNAAVLNSGVAVEMFSVEFLTKALLGGHPAVDEPWEGSIIRTYMTGPYAPGLSVNGRLLVGYQQLLGIPLTDTQEFSAWKRLYEMRNKLAHGRLDEFRGLTRPSGQRFATAEERAHFAYETAVRMIYYVRYYRLGS